MFCICFSKNLVLLRKISIVNRVDAGVKGRENFILVQTKDLRQIKPYVMI